MIALACAGAMLWLWPAPPAGAGRAPAFIGVNGCRCHKPELDDWSLSAHANAITKLSPSGRSKHDRHALENAKLDPAKDYSTDSKCLPCHVTGYLEQGGYETAQTTPLLAGVGCEMCHGPGEEYRDIHKNKDETYTRPELAAAGQRFPHADRTVCEGCHTSDKKPDFGHEKFQFEKAIREAQHWHRTYELKFKHE